MGPIERVARRALNPISTRVTMLVQGTGTRRAFGVRRSEAVPQASATFVPDPVRRPRMRRRGGLRAPIPVPGPVRKSSGGLLKAGGQVVVPDVAGLAWGDAEEVLHRAGLVAVGPEPGGPPPARSGGAVVDQRPEPGVVVAVGTAVTVWIERGPGSAGVREPRRPRPEPRSASGMVDEESGEAIG